MGGGEEKSHVKQFDRPTHYDGVHSVMVDLGGTEEEEVFIDPEHGPQLYRPDGPPKGETLDYNVFTDSGTHGFHNMLAKGWQRMTSTEQKIAVHITAKRNRRFKEQHFSQA
mmetsp:Transcript_58667/g.132218  ORF Transcript_58667/g.132218 Transcript_58667/m.132218 type:complete len:111 (-) Transcript_58667:173-505(-)